MLKNYLKIAWRNLLKNKGYAVINIGGLAIGLTVSLLIAFWVYDELSYNKQNSNYDRIAQVYQNVSFDRDIETWGNQNYPLGEVLRDEYENYFEHVVMANFRRSILKLDENIISQIGSYMDFDAPELWDLQMVHGSRANFNGPNSLFLSASVAKALFGNANPLGKAVLLDNNVSLKVSGVYEDLPRTSRYRERMNFIAPLDLITQRKGVNITWGNNWLSVFVQLKEGVSMQLASKAIKDVKLERAGEREARSKPELFLHPMAKWHLYHRYENGVNTGGNITYIWLFGFVGAFVLLLASINFINLSTARSQKRAEEVGVRKVIGSSRMHLIQQFFSESLLVVLLAFILALLLAQLTMPFFNQVAEKNMKILWESPLLWGGLFIFIVFVGLLSGIYPALYLSNFKPVKVLKGTFNAGASNARFRRVLVTVQFFISVSLIIGTLVVYEQIQFVKNRPIGYDLDQLVTVPLRTQEAQKNYAALREALLRNTAFQAVARSENSIVNTWSSDFDYQWKGKDPNFRDNIFRGVVTYDFGKTIGWNILEGRDFSRDFPSDSNAVILNEAAVAYMGLEEPIGEIITAAWGEKSTVIGVVEDMITQSLYESNKQTIFRFDNRGYASLMNIRLNPNVSVPKALAELQTLFKTFNPNTPLEYDFAKDLHAQKFEFEARIGTLARVFAILAIFISCLGLLGLASFLAERRTKEIGIRKVLGASIYTLWQMLSKELIGLVLIGSVLAIPLTYYLMHQWLLDYEYRTELSWSIFALACGSVLLITLLTISFQTIKAAKLSPIKSLRTE